MKQKKLMPQIVAPVNRHHWEKGSTMVTECDQLI
jgi:hypothetical protein